MKKLSFRMKLALLFTVAFVALLCVLAVIFYFALKPAMERQSAEHCAAEAIRVAGEVERDTDSGVTMEDNFELFESPYFSVYDLNGRVIVSNHDMNWFDELPSDQDAARKVFGNGAEWMVYDAGATEDGQMVAIVRVGARLEAVTEATNQTLIIFLILLPIGGALALLVGLVIARRALRPVSEMTKAAVAISKGDLSRRVDDPKTRDEIGALALTFNEMISSMQDTVERERQFSSDASHELRTPLAVILANSEAALSDDASNLERRQALETIYDKGGHMQSMLTQLLMLARGAEQANAMEISEIKMDEFAEDVAESCKPEAINRDIDINVDSEADIIVEADLLLLTRAALNLVNNAIRYGRNGGNVWIMTKNEGDNVAFSVRDDGMGIAPEHLNHIFDRFYQVNADRGGIGSGLGLSLVKYIAELHGGSVSVESEPGAGSVFTLTIPRKK